MSLLEAMLFPQQQLQEEQELFGYEDDEDHFYKYLVQQQQQEASSGCFIQHDIDEVQQGPPATTTRRKRRRTRTLKNKEELENQRRTHINVERNRRKQMNYYLAVLRSMMPPSYVPRGDQGSIVGGAINYVKELEHLLQTLEAGKHTNDDKEQQPLNNIAHNNSNSSNNSIFSNFFAFPQYSTLARIEHDGSSELGEEKKKKKKGVADVEVTVVEGHANVKVKSRRRPKQLMKMVVAFQSLRLTILHLNVTTIDLHVLYSFSVKVEDDCEVASVDEIAAAVHEIVSRIHHEDPNCSIN